MSQLSVSRSAGLSLFKSGSIEGLTWEQYAIIAEAVAYVIDLESKSLQDKRDKYTVKVVNR